MQEPVVQFVIPMAGAGSRFQKAGYKLPKPLIPVLGKPMIQLVVENLTPKSIRRNSFFSYSRLISSVITWTNCCSEWHRAAGSCPCTV